MKNIILLLIAVCTMAFVKAADASSVVKKHHPISVEQATAQVNHVVSFDQESILAFERVFTLLPYSRSSCKAFERPASKIHLTRFIYQYPYPIASTYKPKQDKRDNTYLKAHLPSFRRV